MPTLTKQTSRNEKFISNHDLMQFLPREDQRLGPQINVWLEGNDHHFRTRLVCLGGARGVEFSNGRSYRHADIKKIEW